MLVVGRAGNWSNLTVLSFGRLDLRASTVYKGLARVHGVGTTYIKAPCTMKINRVCGFWYGSLRAASVVLYSRRAAVQ